MKTGNIGIRNLADIGVSDIDVYGTRKTVNTYPNIFVLFFRSRNQSTGDLPKIENKKIKYDEQYDGSFGFDTYVPKMYPAREIKESYFINSEIKTKIKTKFLDRNEFKMKDVGDENYYISSACILKDKEVKLQIKGFLERLRDSYTIDKITFKFVRLNEQKLPVRNSSLKFEDYTEENLKIIMGKDIVLSNNEIFNGEITIKAMKEYDDHIGLICYYTDTEGKEILVGQCNFSPNQKITVPLKFIKVKIFSNGTQKYPENHTFDINALSNFLNNKTMGQSSVSVSIPNTNVEVLKMEEIYTELNTTTNQQEVKFNLSNFIEEVDLKNKGDLATVFKRDKIWATKDDNSEAKLDNQIKKLHQIEIENKLKNSNDVVTIYDKFKSKLGNNFTKDDLIVELKRIYFETYIPFYLLEDITFKIYQDNNGSWRWTEAFEANLINSHRLKILVSKFSLIYGVDSYSTYAHELAHGLGVNHIFEGNNNAKIQNEGITLENVMDYYTSIIEDTKVFIPKPYVFIRKQWDAMKAYYGTRISNANKRYDDLVGSLNVKELKNDCENLFAKL
ncbi:hypothetical protein [Chryseobacterium camelliae]|uniref:hypothetical protein n=1 Tax=Chryseobacterium camelliae TaxID=1265445 RepID=UPI000C1C95C4|nr:hypothetical protein [Chryseobacterium camelliae]